MTRTVYAAIAGVALATGAQTGAAVAEAPDCELDRPVIFAGLDWDSAQFHNEVAQFIMEQGYGCETDAIPGSTMPMLAGMARGDVDVTMEIWKANFVDAWNEVEEEGKVADLGLNFPDSRQAWYVPRYLVEGPDAEAPDLRSVSDLPKYKDLFSDPEQPDKGRFYNCILGWACEEINTKKLYAYGLEDDFTNFRPGTGAALSAAIASNYKRGKPFLAYYWEPTWVLGQYDLVALEEPEYDEETWSQMKDEERPEVATAYPEIPVLVGVNTEFQEQAPNLIEFLTEYETTSADVSEALAYIQENPGATTADAAIKFLKENEDLWRQWVPDDVAERVAAAVAEETIPGE